jgi:hypothetical protein
MSLRSVQATFSWPDCNDSKSMANSELFGAYSADLRYRTALSAEALRPVTAGRQCPFATVGLVYTLRDLTFLSVYNLSCVCHDKPYTVLSRKIYRRQPCHLVTH